MTEQERLDMFAAAALAGLLAGQSYSASELEEIPENIACDAARLGRAMMRATRSVATVTAPTQAPAPAPAPGDKPRPWEAGGLAAIQQPVAPTAASTPVEQYGDPADLSIYEVVGTGITQAKQVYLNIHMKNAAGDKAYFRFYMNAGTEASKTEWEQCLSAFITALGMERIENDSDEMLGKKVRLHGNNLINVAKASAIMEALGFTRRESGVGSFWEPAA